MWCLGDESGKGDQRFEEKWRAFDERAQVRRRRARRLGGDEGDPSLAKLIVNLKRRAVLWPHLASIVDPRRRMTIPVVAAIQGYVRFWPYSVEKLEIARATNFGRIGNQSRF
jgi:hypothetical protein